MPNLIETNYTYKSNDDGFIYGTFHTKFSFGDIEQKFDTLFRKRGTFQNDDFERAQTIVFSEISQFENIAFHPTLLSQLILIMAGAELVFHRDNQIDHPEANFHTVGFHFHRLIASFSNLASEKPDEMKPAREFTGAVLKGRWYKHVEDASLGGMATNILNEAARGDWIKDSLVENFGPFDASKLMTKEHTDFIVEQYISTSIKRRTERNELTGEWLVFDKQEDKLCLLTLASHQEDDQRILDRFT